MHTTVHYFSLPALLKISSIPFSQYTQKFPLCKFLCKWIALTFDECSWNARVVPLSSGGLWLLTSRTARASFLSCVPRRFGRGAVPSPIWAEHQSTHGPDSQTISISKFCPTVCMCVNWTDQSQWISPIIQGIGQCCLQWHDTIV